MDGGQQEFARVDITNLSARKLQELSEMQIQGQQTNFSFRKTQQSKAVSKQPLTKENSKDDSSLHIIENNNNDVAYAEQEHKS